MNPSALLTRLLGFPIFRFFQSLSFYPENNLLDCARSVLAQSFLLATFGPLRVSMNNLSHFSRNRFEFEKLGRGDEGNPPPPPFRKQNNCLRDNIIRGIKCKNTINLLLREPEPPRAPALHFNNIISLPVIWNIMQQWFKRIMLIIYLVSSVFENTALGRSRCTFWRLSLSKVAWKLDCTVWA